MSTYKRLSTPPKYRKVSRMTSAHAQVPYNKEAMKKVVEDFVDWKDNDASNTGEKEKLGVGIERYFKWTPGDSKNPRRNVSSVESHYRKLRINEIRKIDPDGFKRLQKDIQKTVQGGYVSNLKTTVKKHGGYNLKELHFTLSRSENGKSMVPLASITHGTTTVKDFCTMKMLLMASRVLARTLVDLRL